MSRRAYAGIVIDTLIGDCGDDDAARMRQAECWRLSSLAKQTIQIAENR